MARIFVYDGRRHDDPDPAATEEEVRSLMAQWYPDLANATTEHERNGADNVVIFRRRVGNKGSVNTPGELAARLSEVRPKSLRLVEEYGRNPNWDSVDDAALDSMAEEAERYMASAKDARWNIERLAR